MRTIYNFDHSASIKSIIDSVATILTLHAPTGTTVTRPKVERRKSCKGIISVTSYPSGYPGAPKGTPRPTDRPEDDYFTPLETSRERLSVTIYAFYASATHPTQLGSIAIYSSDPVTLATLLRKRKSLFGFRVRDCRLELGRHPFVDVTLA